MVAVKLDTSRVGCVIDVYLLCKMYPITSLSIIGSVAYPPSAVSSCARVIEVTYSSCSPLFFWWLLAALLLNIFDRSWIHLLFDFLCIPRIFDRQDNIQLRWIQENKSSDPTDVSESHDPKQEICSSPKFMRCWHGILTYTLWVNCVCVHMREKLKKL